MKYTVAILAAAVAVSAQTPPGCSENFSGTFEISPVNVTGTITARDLENARKERFSKRQACTNTPIAILKNGILTDQNNRQGEIVANQQFQFDDILQPDALFTTGFSICANGTLAIGGSAIFYSCKSGSFSNLYHESQGEQCGEIYIDTQACDSPSGTQSAATASLTTSSSSSSSSSFSSSSSTLTPSTTAPATTSSVSVPPTTLSTSSSTTPTIVAPIPVTTSATIIPPFPAGNDTTPAASGTASAPVTTSSSITTSSSTTPATTTSPAAYQPSSSAGVLAIGGQLFAAAAAIVAFAMF